MDRRPNTIIVIIITDVIIVMSMITISIMMFISSIMIIDSVLVIIVIIRKSRTDPKGGFGKGGFCNSRVSFVRSQSIGLKRRRTSHSQELPMFVTMSKYPISNPHPPLPNSTF